MYLKNYLRKEIKDTLDGLKNRIVQEEETLKLLNEVNIQKANYVVYLHSLWTHEGEKSTSTEHNGTLEEAVRKAEIKFMKINKREDIQATYSVAIRIGELEYDLPKEYWEHYRKKYSSKC